MRKVNLRDANQQFSQLVREVQETREPVAVYRHGELAVEIHPPAAGGARQLAPEKEAALKAIFELAHRVRGKSKGPKPTRDELHER